MAITLVQTKEGTLSNVSSGTITLNSSTTSGNTLICVINYGNSGYTSHVSGITLGGAAGNFSAAKVKNQIFAPYNEIWEDWACAGGQTAVAVSFSAASSALVDVYEFSGLITTASAFDVSATAGNSGTAWSSGATTTTSQANELVVGAIATNSSITAPSSPWINGTVTNFDASPDWGLASYQIVSTAAAYTYSGNQASSTGWGASVGTFKAAASTALAPVPYVISQSVKRSGYY